MFESFTLHVGLKEIAKRTFKESMDDDILNLAAQLAYYFLFALFPALLCVIAITSYLPLNHFVDDVAAALGRFMPQEGLKLIQDQMVKLAGSRDGGLIGLGFLGALWSSTAAVSGLMNALNSAYDIQEGRPWWKVRLIAVALTLALAVFVVLATSLVLAGPQLADLLAHKFGLSWMFVTAWKIVQWPLAFALVSTAIGLVYYFAPDAEQDWTWITPGSLVATLLWLIVSLAFRMYVVRFGNYDATYGAVGAVIVLLTWFYLTGIVILVGAEMNAEIEHASPWGKAPGEKVPGEKVKLGTRAARAFQKRWPGHHHAPDHAHTPEGANAPASPAVPAAGPASGAPAPAYATASRSSNIQPSPLRPGKFARVLTWIGLVVVWKRGAKS